MARKQAKPTKVTAMTVTEKATRKERKARDPLTRNKTQDEKAMMAAAEPKYIPAPEETIQLPTIVVKPSRKIGCVRVIVETYGRPYICDGIRIETGQAETLYIVTGVGMECDICCKPAPGLKAYKAIQLSSVDAEGDRKEMVKEVKLEV